MKTLITAATAVLAVLGGCRPKAEPAPPASAATVTDTANAPVPAPAVATPPQSSKPTRPPPTAPAQKPKPAVAAKPAIAAKPAPAVDTAPPVRDQWHPAPRDTLDSDTYQGWKQYELNCSRCHGEYAVGTSFAPSLVVSLKEGGTVPTKEAFITTVCAGRLDKGMPSWCALGLEMAKIEQMYQYAKGRADGKISPGRPAQRE